MVHRSQFLEELIKLLLEGCAEFKKRLVGVEYHCEKVVCIFGNGTEMHADAVVGCDGIRSECLPFVFNDGRLVEHVFM